MNPPVLSRPLAVADVRGETTVEIVADADERAALAGQYDLLGVGSLAAAVTVSAQPDGAVAVAGRLTADIEQACVVSLVPVAQRIDEPFAVRFVRPGSPELPDAGKPHAEIVVDPAAPDPPELLTGNAIDLGQIVEEAFVLAIDPYPRAEGAALPDEAAGEGGTGSPFAALAALKGRKV